MVVANGKNIKVLDRFIDDTMLVQFYTTQTIPLYKYIKNG